MKTLRKLSFLSVLVLFSLSTSMAVAQNAGPAEGGRDSLAVMFDLSPGPGSPPATLGGYTMTPVPFPGAPGCTGELSPITTPGGPLDISPTDGSSRCIGSGWSTWSHGYVGDVYYTGGPTSQTLTMPAGTVAFYFYVEPNPFAVHDFEVVADGVSSGVFPADGSGGAVYVGVYDDSGGTISSITVRCVTGVDFATGEYGWAGRQGCDCMDDLTASYSAGTMSLTFALSTPGPAVWANYLILTTPTISVVPLWTINLPEICPPVTIPISYPFPSVGVVGFWTGLFDATGPLCFDLEWVTTK